MKQVFFCHVEVVFENPPVRVTIEDVNAILTHSAVIDGSVFSVEPLAVEDMADISVKDEMGLR